MSMRGERMLVTGHRQGAICVWDIAARPRRDDDAGRNAEAARAQRKASARIAFELMTSVPPPDIGGDGGARPTPTTLRDASALKPLSVSDHMVRGVAVVDAHGLPTAGPALVYSNRAGALTKLCTVDDSELEAFGDLEWEKYGAQDEGHDEGHDDGHASAAGSSGVRGAPWE